MKCLFIRYHGCRLSFYLIILLVLACQKDRSPDEQSEKLYDLKFEFNGFTSTKGPLKHASVAVEKLASISGDPQNQSTGYLFFWSFNNESLQPDMGIPSGEYTRITYNDGIIPSEYGSSGYAYGGYVAGKSLTFRGANEIIFEMPLHHVQEIKELGFDIGSSNTGPKAFEIYYSLDGEDYIALQLINQFGANGGTNYPKNSFMYDLQGLVIAGDRLWIKIIPQPGERVEGSTFNPATGITRIDNFRLEGSYELTQTNPISKLHYFIYHRDKRDLFHIGEIEDWDDFQVQLPLGRYDVCFVLNQSALDLALPAMQEDWNTLFVSNYFVNSQAEIFGFVGEIDVQQNETYSFTLSRMYSQVKLEFTDANLDVIDKVVVSAKHDPLYFVPSKTPIPNPVLDQTEISFEEGIPVNKQILFNQFIGLVSDPQSLLYQVDVYSVDGLIRTFELESTIKNNMQLVFRGELLNGVQVQNGFLIQKNETWDGEIEDAF